jgi:hypothetical protein
LKKKLVIFLLLISFLNANDTEKYFHYAQDYYWLSVDEGVGSSVYFKTIKYLKKAKEENEKFNKDVNYKSNKANINALSKELNSFYETNHLTMEGFFPMLRYVSTSFFFFPEKSRQHTLQKPAILIATEDGVENLAATLEKMRDQSSFNSIPGNMFFNTSDPLLNESIFCKFNSDGNFFIHLTEEVTDALSDDKKLLKDFYANNITPEIIQKLSAYSGDKEFILVHTESANLEKEDSSVTAYATSYSVDTLKNIPSKSSVASSYAIDEKGNWLSIILIHFILLAIVFAATLYFKKSNQALLSALIIPIIGFAVGRITPWVIIPTIGSIMPGMELYILYTTWWVAILGVAIIFVPVYAMDFIYNKISTYITLPIITGKGALIGLSVSAGVASYLFIPYVFVYGNLMDILELFANYILVALAILVSGYLTGKILDKSDKTNESFMLVSIIAAISIFLSLMHNDMLIVDIVSVIVIFLCVIVLIKTKTKVEIEIEEDVIETSATDLDSLIKSPTYNEFDYYTKSLNKLKGL